MKKITNGINNEYVLFLVKDTLVLASLCLFIDLKNNRFIERNSKGAVRIRAVY